MKQLTTHPCTEVYNFDEMIKRILRPIISIREREFLYDDVGGVLRELLYLELELKLRNRRSGRNFIESLNNNR
jgi:hypothetical protein